MASQRPHFSWNSGDLRRTPPSERPSGGRRRTPRTRAPHASAGPSCGCRPRSRAGRREIACSPFGGPQGAPSARTWAASGTARPTKAAGVGGSAARPNRRGGGAAGRAYLVVRAHDGEGAGEAAAEGREGVRPVALVEERAGDAFAVVERARRRILVARVEEDVHARIREQVAVVQAAERVVAVDAAEPQSSASSSPRRREARRNPARRAKPKS